MRSEVRVCRYYDSADALDLRDGDIVFNTTSRSGDIGIEFSPFRLGPVTVNISGVDYTSKTMENAWQYTKVYEQHVDMFGVPGDNWVDWRNEGFSNPRAVRYPMGKGVKPLFSFNGEKLSYVEARKKIYIPLYRDAVVKTWTFAVLREAIDRGVFRRVWLRDFDAYDHVGIQKSLTEVIEDPHRKCGHAFVLWGLLTGELQ